MSIERERERKRKQSDGPFPFPPTSNGPFTSFPFLSSRLAGDGTMSFAEFLELMADVMSQTTRWGNLSTKLSGYVGFDTIQEQIKRKSIKRGFELNLMVVGESPLLLP